MHYCRSLNRNLSLQIVLSKRQQKHSPPNLEFSLQMKSYGFTTSVRFQNFLSNCSRGRHDAAIRVVQSVGLVSHLPAIIFTNAGSALVMSMMLTDERRFWHQLLPVIVIWLLLLPSLLSWLRLRTYPTPRAVSHRRVRRIFQYSLFLGTVWALLMLTLLPTQSPPVVMLMVAGLAFMCVGGTAVMSNNPLACLGYSAPIFAAGFFIAATQTFRAHWVLVFVLMLLGFGIIWILSGGMQPILEILSLKSERAGLIEDLEGQLKTQAALIASSQVAQDELAVSEERFRALALLSSDWYWEQDANFRFIKDPSRISGLYSELRKSLFGKTRWEAAPDNPASLWNQHR
jgi:PAS domain-containing protein